MHHEIQAGKQDGGCTEDTSSIEEAVVDLNLSLFDTTTEEL